MAHFTMNEYHLDIALCVMARGGLYQEVSKNMRKTITSSDIVFDFTDKLNTALNNRDAQQDVRVLDVSIMLNELSREDKAAPHKRGFVPNSTRGHVSYLEKHKARRMTDRLRKSWLRSRAEAAVRARKLEKKRKEECLAAGIEYRESASPFGVLHDVPARFYAQGYGSSEAQPPPVITGEEGSYFTCKEIHDLVQNREEHAVVTREFSPEELAKINAGEEKKRKEKMLKFKKHKKAMKEMSQINELQAVKRSPSPKKVRPGRKGYLSSEFVAPEDM